MNRHRRPRGSRRRCRWRNSRRIADVLARFFLEQRLVFGSRESEADSLVHGRESRVARTVPPFGEVRHGAVTVQHEVLGITGVDRIHRR